MLPAFLSSLFNLVGKTLSGFTGILAAKMGFVSFFIITACLGIPAIILAVIIILYGPDAAKGIREPDENSIKV